MNNNFILPSILMAITLAIAGCGSSPDARFYVLNALDRNSTVPTETLSKSNVAVKVGPISIPDTLDQTQIVTRSGSNMLVLDEFNRWGGDLQNDFQRILAENISLLLPTDNVILNQEISLIPIDFQVMVNVREFDGHLAGMVTLNADWTIVAQDKEKTTIAKKSVFHENTDGADYQSYVAAQSRLLAKLSQEITDTIRSQLK